MGRQASELPREPEGGRVAPAWPGEGGSPAQPGWDEPVESLAEVHAPESPVGIVMPERMAVARPPLPLQERKLATAVRSMGPLTIVPGRYVHSSPLTYQIDRLVEQHQIQIERTTAIPDEYGAEEDPLWAMHSTLFGLFWWWPTHGAGRFVEEATPQRSVDITGGGCMFPLGTDVTELDRIGAVFDQDHNLEVEGPLRVVSLRELPTHIELSVERP